MDESASSAREASPTVAESLREYGRGLAGGLMFSLPLLYTMEVWWSGFIATPERLLAYVALVFVLLLGYNRYAGMHPDASFAEVIIDSVEEYGLGIVTATGVLYLLGRIGAGESLEEMSGKIVVEAGIVAIGFSVGTAQLGSGEEDEEGESDGNDEKSDEAAGFGDHVVLAACGATLFAANVAPTEEIVVIAVETVPVRLLGIAAVSIALAALVLYFSDFAGSKRLARAGTPFDVVVGTVVTYGIALTISAIMLWFFGRFDGVSAGIAARQVIVLGFPSVLGASAGRLLLQQ